MSSAPKIKLDRKAFDEVIPLLGLRIPAAKCSVYLKEFDQFSFCRPKMRRITDVPKEDGKDTAGKAPQERLLLLREDITDAAAQLPAKLLELNAQLCGGGGEGESATTAAGSTAIPNLVNTSVTIGYDHLSVNEILKRILQPTAPASTAAGGDGPSIADIPSSFEQIGHIAHLNLRDDQLPHKHLIGEVILDKNKSSIKTVVNKTNAITNEFRVFPMEIIAGVDDFKVKLIQSGARFEFEFNKVYWNSRLQTEHDRIIALVSRFGSAGDDRGGGVRAVNGEGAEEQVQKKMKLDQGDAKPSTLQPVVVADMMGGVGPFTIPLGLEAATVVTAIHSNDLNPNSYAALVNNAVVNHCNWERAGPVSAADNDATPATSTGKGGAASSSYKRHNNTNGNTSAKSKTSLPLLSCYNMDGREFIRLLDGSAPATATSGSAPIAYTDVIMNLPASATEFLDVFIGRELRRKVPASSSGSGDGDGSAAVPVVLPRIHVYAFSKADDPVLDIADRVCRTIYPSRYSDAAATSDGAGSAAVEAQGGDRTLTPLGRIVYHDNSKPNRALLQEALHSLKHDNVVQVPASMYSAGARATAVQQAQQLVAEKQFYCLSHIVRDVAPRKVMVCLSFFMPLDAMFQQE